MAIRIRELRTLAEIEPVVEIARAVWRMTDRDLPASHDLLATVHSGGLLAGAFDGKRLVGFIHGIPRTNLGEPCQHSNMLGVLPAARGTGIGLRLKLFQRRSCLERGIRLATWTYDPLIVRNAQLNIGRLRARAVRYLPDFYGRLGGIYGDLPTDRFEVEWRLDAPEVAAAAAGRRLATPDLQAWPAPGNARERAAVAVPIPLGAPESYARDPEAALEARLRLRGIASRLMADGYEATRFHVLPDRAIYGFEPAVRARQSELWPRRRGGRAGG